MMRRAALTLLLAAAAAGCRFFAMKPLEVIDWTPREQQVDLAGLSGITIRFSQEVNKTLAEEAFSLAESGKPVAGSFLWSSGDTFAFQPSIDWKEGRIYTIRVDTSAEDIFGNSLREDFTHRFGSSAESDRPRLQSISPPDQALIDELRAPIVIGFSEAMNPTSVQEGFTLSPSVDGYITWDPTATMFQFTPTEEYGWQTAYLLTLDTDVADTSGNTLAETVRHHFFVGSESDAPQLLSAQSDTGGLSVTPDDDGGTLVFTDGWEKDMALVLTFSEAMDASSSAAALSWSPQFAYDTSWGGGNTTLTIRPKDPLAWDTLYSLTVSEGLQDLRGNGLQLEGPLRLRVTGAGSRPPGVVKAAFLAALNPDAVTELHSFDSLTFDGGYAPPAADYLDNGNSFLDLYFHLSAGAEIDYFSLLEAFSINCQNASITPLGLQLDGSVTYSVNNPVPPGLPYGDPDYHVARFILGVNNDGVYNNSPGLLTISLDAGFTDTLGNPLGDPWRMTLVTTN